PLPGSLVTVTSPPTMRRACGRFLSLTRRQIADTVTASSLEQRFIGDDPKDRRDGGPWQQTFLNQNEPLHRLNLSGQRADHWGNRRNVVYHILIVRVAFFAHGPLLSQIRHGAIALQDYRSR